ncbi:hypothetical protein V6N11_010065 [Hibiscus sabdariffa]|uniref:Reverse transcriptase zinc-binding domain-containing protein n=1 Tax=Hibiscus sabdariffa TaxID=183260 RepID=A0ABR2PDW1_9ROSI
MVDATGSWDWPRISQWLLHIILEKIAAVKPLQIGAGADVPGSRWEKSRNFSVKMAYKLVEDTNPLNVNMSWAKIWKLPVPQYIRVFLWITLHQRLLTNIERGNIQEFLSIPFSSWILQCDADSARFGKGDTIWATRFAASAG